MLPVLARTHTGQGALAYVTAATSEDVTVSVHKGRQLTCCLFWHTGQGALAYVTAATHGLSDVAQRLQEALPAELVAELDAGLERDARLLLPPAPILKEDNWPLLTVSKGFFESLAAGGAPPGSAPF